MLGDFTAFYLSQDELKNAFEINKRFIAPYSPYLFVHIESRFNEETFVGTLAFADYNSVPQYTTRSTEGNKTIVKEYYEKRDGAFTFDGIKFFKIINVAQKRDDGMLVFTFKFMNTPSFSEKNTAFMIMPFGDGILDAFYKETIKDYLKQSDLVIQVFRSDDFAGSDIVVDTILIQIKKAEFIICDITNCNKNVFFEIGYAKALNKDIIFLLEHDKPPSFFDVNHIRRIEYSYRKQKDFQELLRATIINIRSNRP